MWIVSCGNSRGRASTLHGHMKVISPSKKYDNPSVTAISEGVYHTCALRTDASLWCWGGNSSGQLGTSLVLASSNSKTATPAQVPGAWLQVDTGQSHTCAIASDNSLWCWGDNSAGQLGDGTHTAQALPVRVVVPGQSWASVKAGLSHTCALSLDGDIWCWGDNGDGQLGIGSNTQQTIPQRVEP